MPYSTSVPTFNHDFWSDEVILNPYPYYRELREAGPAVWLSRNEAWAITRYDNVREALLNGEIFSSARGVMMNDDTNAAVEGIMLCSDDPKHRELRRIFSRPLTVASVGSLKQRLANLANTHVDRLVERGTFDAVVDLAHYLPLTVVTELVGLGDEGKANMLTWAAGIFNAFGPDSCARTLSGKQITGQAFAYLNSMSRETLDPGGWGAALFEAAGRGEIELESAKAMLMDYLAPALDTTINATSAAIWLFAKNPAEWSRLRASPDLVGPAIDEVVRLESPIRAFARYVVQDYKMGDVILPAGSRALMLYACANRDERKYLDPDRFDVARNPRDHLGFGFGSHMCAGMHLAKLEMTVLLEALMRRIRNFKIIEERREPHNTLRGLAKLVISVDAE